MHSDRLGAHLPWREVDIFLDKILELGLVPEIAVKGPELDALDYERIARVRRALDAAALRPTVHAPFFDLNPGALDPLIRQASAQRLTAALRFAQQLNAHLMVIHPGYDKWRYPNLAETWGDLAAEFFASLLPQAAASDCRLALENIYEETPTTLVRLVETLDSEWFGHCFDTGHWHLFGRIGMTEWLAAIGPRLMHLHLHDNHGSADEHLPVGAGVIDFAPLRDALGKLPHKPSMTLEAHSAEHLVRSQQEVSAWGVTT